jgi:hypothetical protein
VYATPMLLLRWVRLGCLNKAMRMFLAAPRGRIAQLVERGANNAAVLGSSPSMTTQNYFCFSLQGPPVSGREIIYYGTVNASIPNI